jgi:hypothetical protein
MSLKTAARQQLTLLIEKLKENELYDPKNRYSLESGVHDLLAKYPLEKNLLIMAVKEDIPRILVEGIEANLPPGMRQAQLAEQLRASYPISKEDAQWAVDSWVEALGIGLIKPKPPDELKQTPRLDWFLGGACALVALVFGGFQLKSFLDWQKLNNDFQTAITDATLENYTDCEAKARGVWYATKQNPLVDQAFELLNKCKLEQVNQLVSQAKLQDALSMAKLVMSGSDSYTKAQALIQKWSNGAPLYIKNSCPYAIDVYIAYSDPKDGYRPKWAGGIEPWRSLAASQSSRLSIGGTVFSFMDPMYIYATNAQDSSYKVLTGNTTIPIGNKTYRLRTMQDGLSWNPEGGHYLYEVPSKLCPPTPTSSP